MVIGERPTVETTIDRKTYSLSRELQATSGTAADFLRNIPSISGDLEGNPSLRGGDSAPTTSNGSRSSPTRPPISNSTDRPRSSTSSPNALRHSKRFGTAGERHGSAGKRLSPQGYRRGNTAVDLGYRHRFRPNFSVTVALSDVFASRRVCEVLDTAELTGSNTVTQASRVVFVGAS